MPLWVPACAGRTTMGGVGPVCAVGVGGGSSRCCGTGDSRIAPTAGVGRTRAGVMRELLVVEGPSTGSGRTDSGSGPTMGSRGMRWGTETSPAPRPCPGIPRERERRWGVWWDALARGVGVRVGARSRGRAVREPPLRPGGAHEGGGDAGAGGGGRWALRQAQGERVWEGRVRWGGGGCDGGRRRAAPRPSGFLPSQE